MIGEKLLKAISCICHLSSEFRRNMIMHLHLLFERCILNGKYAVYKKNAHYESDFERKTVSVTTTVAWVLTNEFRKLLKTRQLEIRYVITGNQITTERWTGIVPGAFREAIFHVSIISLETSREIDLCVPRSIQVAKRFPYLACSTVQTSAAVGHD